MPGAAVTTWRLFFAIPMPADDAACLAKALEPYVTAFPDAGWQRPETYHVTLRFLGATPPDEVPVLVDVAQGCAAGAAGFRMKTGSGDGVLRGRGSVAWCRISEGERETSQIAGCLASALAGSKPATPSAPPHLTVARRVDRALIEAIRGETLGRLDVGWTADRLVLYRSHTGTPAGSSYERIADLLL